MESRLHSRKPVALTAVVGCPQLGLFSVRALNLGVGGMLIDTGSVSLPRGQDVDVCFQISKGPGGRLCTARAEVVHSSMSSAGLKFLTLDPPSRDALEALVRPYPV